MVKLIIDGKEVSVQDGTTILEAAKTVGIDIPTLCYLKDVNEVGACRVCIVEIEGCEALRASCNTLAEEGMVVHTNTPRVRQARRTNVELILSKHNTACTSCVRSGNCSLQQVAKDLNILEEPYTNKAAKLKWDLDAPLIRDDSKCIQCLRCVDICDKVQTMGVWGLIGTGGRAKVGVAGGQPFEAAHCAYCGQCITHCPVGALYARDDTQKVRAAIADPEKIVCVQVAPAVRAAWGDDLGLSADKATVGRMVASLKAVGFNYVFDTDFSADLTIMEEGSEFLERLTHKGEYPMPMFTSCCPGWVRFMKLEYPEFTENLSTAKSPQQMFGAVAKSYWAKLLNVDPEKIFCVSIMPCSCKKYECDVEALNDAASKDVDASLTTRELARMIRGENVRVEELADTEFDRPLGTGTGAAVIFGATGGVMEAALRSAYYLVTGKNPPVDAFKEIRGLEDRRVATFDVQGIPVKVAVASGLGNARKMMEDVKNGRVDYDFIEIMACPGGCAGGGGQPISDGCELAGERGQKLYTLDENAPLRFSHENPDVLKMYEDYLGKPLGEKSHHLLHTEQTKWDL